MQKANRVYAQGWQKCQEIVCGDDTAPKISKHFAVCSVQIHSFPVDTSVELVCSVDLETQLVPPVCADKGD